LKVVKSFLFYNPYSYAANAEIAVAANSVSIVDGDTTPSTTDNTDFGFAQIGIATPKNFVISNTGSVALEVSSISFTGADASLFAVDASVVLPLTIAAGSNATIKLNYTPAAQGISVAEVLISSTFVDESSFNFAIAGQGVLTGLVASSTTTTPYLLPTIADAQFTSILTVGDQVGGYKMVGIPDGAGAFDNNDGTFTMLLNHELGNTVGVTRAHGSIGAFISKWTINKSDLSVVSGSDLIQTTYLWNSTTSAYEQQTAIFNRFCSADLAPVSAFYNAATGNGSQERIFLNGEESGAEARAFAHIASGANTGVTYQLPRMGRYSFENALASPVASDKTIVIGTDDTTPGEVYVYVGTKTNTGNEIERAGLTNGSLYSLEQCRVGKECECGRLAQCD